MWVYKTINSHSSLYRREPILLLHTLVTHFSETSVLILQLDWKTKAQRSRLNKEIINNECFLSSPTEVKTVFPQAHFDLNLEEKSLWICCFFSLLISQDPPLIPWVLWDMFHYGTISSYYVGVGNQGCVCALIQHLFKQMKSLWKFWRGNLLVPLRLTCHPKTQWPQCNLAEDELAFTCPENQSICSSCPPLESLET